MSDKQYEGKFVFVELDSTEAKASRYNNGEWFVHRQTPCTLYCSKLDGAYALHNQQQLPLVGEGRYKVIDSWKDDDEVRRLLSNTKKEIDAVLSGAKKASWCDYVYTGAANTVRQVERTLERNKPTTADLETYTVTVPSSAKNVVLCFK